MIPFRKVLGAALRLARAGIATALLGACSGAPEVGPEPACDALVRGAVPEAVGLVLVLNDTMRRDRAGVYGGPARTPALDAFAAEHLIFERAFSQAPWTVPAIATLFTALYPSQHGVVSHPEGHFVAGAELAEPLRRSDVLAAGHTTLAEVLRRAGYRTAAFVSNPWMDRRFGFDQGFEHYDDSLSSWGMPAPVVTEAALRWIRSLEPGERFFAYVHTLDSHRPYGTLHWDDAMARADVLRADESELEPDIAREIAPLVRFEGEGAARGQSLRKSLALLELAYDKGIENFDAGLALLLDGLGALPGWERTAVIVTSDHGEALYERGYGNHGRGLFDEEMAVPLVVRLPGVSTRENRVQCAVGLIDLMPTLCDYLGVACPEAVSGTSLLGDTSPGWVVSEGVMRHPESRSIRNAEFKLVYEPAGSPDRGRKRNPYSLYDLRTDPGESRDLLAATPPSQKAERIAQVLRERLAEQVPEFRGPEPETTPIDSEMERRLEALGYLE